MALRSDALYVLSFSQQTPITVTSLTLIPSDMTLSDQACQ